MAIWSETCDVLNSADPVIISILSDILGALAESRAPGVYETVVRQALPPLCHALESTTSEQSWIYSSAIDLLCSLVNGGPDEGLGEGFVAVLAPRLFGCLQTSEDRDVLQVLIAILRSRERPLKCANRVESDV